MSVLDYTLKFSKVSKFAPSFVSNLRDEMSRFVMDRSDDMQEEVILLCYMKA